MPTKIISIDGFPLDVSLSETHTMRSDVTEYPVESGANVSDHIRPLPFELSIEGLVSDIPLTNMGPLRPSGVRHSQAAFEHIQKMWKAQKTVHIVTSLRTYENMAVLDVSVPRARDKTGGLWFTAQFRQIDIITNTRTRRTDTPRAQPGGGKGTGKATGPKLDTTVKWLMGLPPGGPLIKDTTLVYYSKADNKFFTNGGGSEGGQSGPRQLATRPGTSRYGSVKGFGLAPDNSELAAFHADLERDARRAAKNKVNTTELHKLVDKGREGLDKVSPSANEVDRTGPARIPKDWAGGRKPINSGGSGPNTTPRRPISSGGG